MYDKIQKKSGQAQHKKHKMKHERHKRQKTGAGEVEVPFGIEYTSSVLAEMLLAQHDSTGHVSKSSSQMVVTAFHAKQAGLLASVYVRLMYSVFLSAVLNRVRKGMSHAVALIEVNRNHGWSVLDLIYTRSPNDDSSDEQKVHTFLARLCWNKTLCNALQSIQKHPNFASAWDLMHESKRLEKTLYLPRPSYTPEHLHIMQKVVQMFAAIRVYRDGISELAAFEIVMECKGINGVVLFG